MKKVVDTIEFRELLTEALMLSKLEITEFQNELKAKYKKAWGSSEWLDARLAKEYTKIIVNNMLVLLDEQEER